MSTKDSSRPIVSVVTQVASDLAYLVQTEIRLARAELGEKVSAAANAGTYIGIAAILLLGGFIVLLIDVARWLEVAGLPFAWSLLLVALVALVAGGVLASVGAGRLKGSNLAPQRTLQQMREDIAVAKEHVR